MPPFRYLDLDQIQPGDFAMVEFTEFHANENHRNRVQYLLRACRVVEVRDDGRVLVKTRRISEPFTISRAEIATVWRTKTDETEPDQKDSSTSPHF